MGKKKKNKKDDFGGYFGKKKAGKKRDRERDYDDIRSNRRRDNDGCKPTVSKDARKSAARAIRKKVKLPEDLAKPRAICNHCVPVDKFISPSEYRRITPQADSFTPALSALVAKYGEENVGICPNCYEAVVLDPTLVTMADFDDARVTLHAAVNIAVGQFEGGKKNRHVDEIKELTRFRDKLLELGGMAELLDAAIGAETDDDDDGGVSRLNGNSGAMYS